MIKKIYPRPDECVVKNNVKCTEIGCDKVFKSNSNLKLHLAKTHGKPELMQSDGLKEYHCPELQCIYHKKLSMKNMKNLRQHYLKVHTEKKSTCSGCQKSFTSDKLLQNHLPYCGVSFTCCNCEVFYHSYENLQTHGRRKKHKILSKLEYTSKICSENMSVPLKKDERFILPKSLNIIVVSNSLTKNQSSQTIRSDNSIYNLAEIKTEKQIIKTSQYSQTMTQPILSSVATQTEVNTNVKEDILTPKILKTSNTQTNSVEEGMVLSDSIFKLNEQELTNIITNSSSTQTYSTSNLYSLHEKFKNTSTTNTSAIMTDESLNNGINNFEFDNCHMETQTDFIFDEMFSSDYLMSNMYTQTCDDVFNQFNFNDIQTQTVFDDMLRSVESQTFMSVKMQNISHTETQTDADFRHMLEVINS